MTLCFTREAFDALQAHVEESEPNEACGLCVSRARAPELVVRIVPLANRHEDPKRAFAFDDAAHLAAQLAVRAAGDVVRAFFHSHPGGTAALSAEDLKGALDGDAPRWPGVDWIVVATRDGAVVDARRFRFEGGRGVAAPLDVARD